MRRYGIFLAYGPAVDLKKEGLGRFLLAFLKAAAAREDVRFAIACPEWSRESLLDLLEDEGVSRAAFDIISTGSLPLILRIVLAHRSRKRIAREPSRLRRLLAHARVRIVRHRQQLEQRIVTARSVWTWLAVAFYALLVSIVLFPFAAALWLLRAIYRACLAVVRGFTRLRWLGSVLNQLMTSISMPGEEALVMRLYRIMEADEAARLADVINTQEDIQAWYCPTAFWPAFNRVAKPGLMCVPDVVTAEFPVGFAVIDREGMRSVEIVESAIAGGENFVTYSSQVKWRTLVDRYSVPPEAVDVVPHACWDLSRLIRVTGFADDETATRRYSEARMQEALNRSGGERYARDFASDALCYFFYPSQLRPNKNVVTLLRAYEHLLRKRFIQRKLILTGDPTRLPSVRDFIQERRLERDVLCLHALTAVELAACFRLADLAVNPSLSEGGCPFTFTEALSVGTPAVMARIPVTEEVITDPELQHMMLFDPYDWEDAAAKMEWALENRDLLLSAQKTFYSRLAERTWKDVVDDHVAILDRLAGSAARAAKT